MEILILAEMKKGTLSGYDVIGLVHKKFDIFVSSGTVYSLLYSLERDGLIKGAWDQRKRVYELSEKGERNMEIITKASDEFQNFLRNLSHYSMQTRMLSNRHMKPGLIPSLGFTQC